VYTVLSVALDLLVGSDPKGLVGGLVGAGSEGQLLRKGKVIALIWLECGC